MPHLVEMHKKYAAKGFVVITVALDALIGDEPDKEAPGRALAFLRAKGAAFTNLYLEDRSVDLEAKFRFSEPPAYYVFNRQGKWTLFKPEDAPVDYKAMEQLIVKLLYEK